MTDVTVIHVGEGKEPYYAAAESEYIKRLGAYCRYRTVMIKEERIDDEASDALIGKALSKEAEAIKRAIPQGSYIIALCVEGKQLSSQGLSELIGRVTLSKPITYIIGSSHGLDGSIKALADCKLSFSLMTFPHRLMRVILAEQTYRAFTILAGKNYHK